MARANKPGDIFHIRTPEGLAFFQYICKHDRYGHLIRILPGLFNAIPSSFEELAQSTELYYIFFPLTAAISKGIVTYAASMTLPVSAGKPPTLRRAGARAQGGKALNWWILDPSGDEFLVNELNDKQARYSIAAIWNDTLLVERICSGWLPEQDT